MRTAGRADRRPARARAESSRRIPMREVRTIIIGAGQAGLALSWHLTTNGHDHVVLDRGDIAERWRSERWDSLRTLTPNWMSRLPGRHYEGADPDGFMPAAQIAQRLADYTVDF